MTYGLNIIVTIVCPNNILGMLVGRLCMRPVKYWVLSLSATESLKASFAFATVPVYVSPGWVCKVKNYLGPEPRKALIENFSR